MRRSRTGVISVLAVGMVAGTAVGVAAQDEAPAPVGLGGRIEVPEAGYAVSVPEDWVIVRPATGNPEAVVNALDPDLAALVRPQLDNYSLSLMAYAPSSAVPMESCNVVSLQHGGLPADVIVEGNLEILAGLDRTSEPEVSTLELPLGDVTQIDYEMGMATPSLIVSAWLYIDTETYHVLTCAGADGPDDAWVSVAESFEFLPTTMRDRALSVGVFLAHATGTASRYEEELRRVGNSFLASEPDFPAIIVELRGVEGLVDDHIGWLDGHPPMPCYRDVHEWWRTVNVELLTLTQAIRQGIEAEDPDLLREAMDGFAERWGMADAPARFDAAVIACDDQVAS